MSSFKKHFEKAHQLFTSGVKVIRERAGANRVVILKDSRDTSEEKVLIERWSDPAMIAQDCASAI